MKTMQATKEQFGGIVERTMKVKGKYGQVYEYKVYRHVDRRRRTPRKCTVRIDPSGAK